MKMNRKLIGIVLMLLMAVTVGAGFNNLVFAAGTNSVTVNGKVLTYDTLVYVDEAKGDDASGDGSVDKPFKTFNKAYEAIPATSNSAIYLRAGNYVCSVDGVKLKPMTIIGEGRSTVLKMDKLQHDPGPYNYATIMYSVEKINMYKLVFTTGAKVYDTAMIQSGSGSKANFYNVLFDLKCTVGSGFFGNLDITFENCNDYSNTSPILRSDVPAVLNKVTIINSYGGFTPNISTKVTDYFNTNSTLSKVQVLNSDYTVKTDTPSQGVYYGDYSWNDTSVTPVANPTLDILASKERVRVGDTFTADAIFKNVTGIYAEDFKVNYDVTKFEYLGYEEIEGYKVCNATKGDDNTLRFIIVSKGKNMGITGEKAVVKLKFKAIAVGTGKVDALKGRIADTTDEYDLEEVNCLEDTVIVEAPKDVNRTGEYTLVDLALDGFYYQMAATETDLTKHDADQDMSGMIDDLDLTIIVDEMLKNGNYALNL